MRRVTGLLIVALCACGNITRKQDDAGTQKDDAPPDTKMIDAGVDMMMLVPTEAREILPGGSRMQSTTYTMDCQLGHFVQQIKASGATYTLEGNAAVKP